MRFISILMAMAMVAWTGPLRAAPVHDFHAALAEATQHYRFAGFYLHTGNPGVAAIELQSLRDNWRDIEAVYGAAPPDLYANDADWSTTLAEIGRRIDGAMAAVDADDMDKASRDLKPIRRALVQLRRRNGLFVFADYVEEANRAMDALFEFRRRPIDFDDPDSVRTLLSRTAVTSDWYRRCMDGAPETYRQSEEFKRLIEISLESLSRIWDAVRERDQRRVINILRELRSSDRLLYLRFG